MKAEKVSEKLLERKLCEAVRKAGGKAIKLVGGIEAGLPDRLVCLPAVRGAALRGDRPRTWFAEIKSTGETLEPLQKVQRAALERIGYTVFVIDSREALAAALKQMGI